MIRHPHQNSRDKAGHDAPENVAHIMGSDIDAGNRQQHRRREEYEPTPRQAVQQKRSRNGKACSGMV